MQISVALRARAKLAVLLHYLLQTACQKENASKLDPRNLRTLRQVVLAVLATRSTRLATMAQAIAPQRRVRSVKAAAMAVGYFLEDAHVPLRPLATRMLEAALHEVDREEVATYRGKALVVLDPTEYAKRSRGRGKRGRQMQHIGRVRAVKAAPKRKNKKKKAAQKGTRTATAGQVVTTWGYVDIWAGLVLKGKRFWPLARQLYSNNHPQIKSQNRVEEAVLWQALALLQRVGLSAIAVADRGLGRKELLIRLAKKGQDLVIRIDADITVRPEGSEEDGLLDAVLARQPWLGDVVWERGQEGPLRCQARAVRATIRFSRSGRVADYQEATLTFLELVPYEEEKEFLVVATTLPVETLSDAKGVAWVYAQRWAIETGFETMHAWGQDRFMVRGWQAIDRLLWIVALAYALLVLALLDRRLVSFRRQAVAVLKRLSVLGRRLTVGKLAEAISLDFRRHHKAWAAAWFG